MTEIKPWQEVGMGENDFGFRLSDGIILVNVRFEIFQTRIIIKIEIKSNPPRI